jgi:orotidine 5'-phosphate decarboxylase subfamily 2
MGKRNFMELLHNKFRQGKHVCVGLDSDYEKVKNIIPKINIDKRSIGIKEDLVSFNRKIIDETKDLVCAYKPNFAFYIGLGFAGLNALRETIVYITEETDVPVILDVKVQDIDNTNSWYVKAYFEFLPADAITMHPYLGHHASLPFLTIGDRGFFILCHTSNQGADEFQHLLSSKNMAQDGMPLYMKVAKNVSENWDSRKNCGLVVGATYPEEIESVRNIAPNIPLLIPGIGEQGGPLKRTVMAAKKNFIINSSRAIIFADDPRKETLKLHNNITEYLKAA